MLHRAIEFIIPAIKRFVHVFVSDRKRLRICAEFVLRTRENAKYAQRKLWPLSIPAFTVHTQVYGLSRLSLVHSGDEHIYVYPNKLPPPARIHAEDSTQ